MKDSYGFLLKLSVILLVLLLILYYSVGFMEKKHEGFTFHHSASKADFNNALSMYSTVGSDGETINVNLDKAMLGKIFGVDLNKMTSGGNTAFNEEISGAKDEHGNYKMPNYDYCDKKYWIPKSAIRSLCPNCDPDKL